MHSELRILLSVTRGKRLGGRNAGAPATSEGTVRERYLTRRFGMSPLKVREEAAAVLATGRLSPPQFYPPSPSSESPGGSQSPNARATAPVVNAHSPTGGLAASPSMPTLGAAAPSAVAAGTTFKRPPLFAGLRESTQRVVVRRPKPTRLEVIGGLRCVSTSISARLARAACSGVTAVHLITASITYGDSLHHAR